ncbi:MAG: LptA/OstA family protein [Alphaproteobacteria bacterium]
MKSLIAAPLIALLLPSLAQAQFARNNSAPIDATADDILNSSGVTVLKGQVDVRQGQTRILADQMKIYSASQTGAVGSAGDISKIEATGNFYYLTPEQEVRGNDGVFVEKDNTFTVTGDVILLQGENVVTGSKLVYNLGTEEARVIGTCQGRKCGSKGRVNILIKSTNGSTNTQ